MEEIYCHCPGSDIRVKGLLFGNQSHDGKSHKKADAIAEQSAQDAFRNTLLQKLIAVSSIEDLCGIKISYRTECQKYSE